MVKSCRGGTEVSVNITCEEEHAWFEKAANFIKLFKDVSREFDEFRVITHLCKLRYWYL